MEGFPPLPPPGRLSHHAVLFPLFRFLLLISVVSLFLNFGFKKWPVQLASFTIASLASVLALASLSGREGRGGMPWRCQDFFGLAVAGRKGGGGRPGVSGWQRCSSPSM